MDSKQLQAYLRQVLSLEVQYQTAEQAYQTCQRKAGQLAIPAVLTPPEKPKSKNAGSSVLSGVIWGLAALAVCAGLGIGLAAFCSNYEGSSAVLGVLTALLSPLSGLLCGALIILGIVLCVLTIKSHADRSKACSAEQKTYELRVQQYRERTAQDASRVSREKEMRSALQKDAGLLDERRKKSKQLLDQFYDLDVIRPKYRNLLCVATFLEYLENERCYSLTGHEGCYNLFEEERQRGIIIAQLTDISRQLSQIRKNQERAADAMEQIQQNTSRLCEGLEALNGKMDIVMQDQRTAAYYAEQAANDQRALNSYVIMRDWINR